MYLNEMLKVFFTRLNIVVIVPRRSTMLHTIYIIIAPYAYIIYGIIIGFNEYLYPILYHIVYHIPIMGPDSARPYYYAHYIIRY